MISGPADELMTVTSFLLTSSLCLSGQADTKYSHSTAPVNRVLDLYSLYLALPGAFVSWWGSSILISFYFKLCKVPAVHDIDLGIRPQVLGKHYMFSVCVCVCVFTHMYVHIFTHVHVHTCTQVFIHA